MQQHLTLAFALGLVAVACSSAPPDSTLGGNDSQQPTAKVPAGGKTPTGSSPTAPTPPTPNDPKTPTSPLSDTGKCGMKATSAECATCCKEKAPDALEPANMALRDCMCAASTCQTACADSVCAATKNGNQPNAACTACLDRNDQTCGDKAAAVCDADAACKAVDACLTTACDPIAMKENPPTP
jgi:hypothetical protein